MRLPVLPLKSPASLYLKVEMPSRPVVAVARLLVLRFVGFLRPATTLILPPLRGGKGWGG